MTDAAQPTSTKPYLVRAIYEWCTDNGYTPYVAVFVNAAARVPMEYVKNREIVLNISFEATQGLKIDNEAITFRARFAGIARELYVPTDNIVAVYARENGQGMAFPLTPELQREQQESASAGETAPAQANSNQADKAAAPLSKTKLSQVPANHPDPEASATTQKPAPKRKGASNGKSAIHAVGPEDTMPSKTDTAASTDLPHDPKEPDGDGNGNGGGAGGARPTLKRVK
jgi:stringent starvation protein B